MGYKEKIEASKKIGTAEKILETLGGERTEKVWELIEKGMKKITHKNFKMSKESKEFYLGYTPFVNNEENKFLVINPKTHTFHCEFDAGWKFRNAKEVAKLYVASKMKNRSWIG